MSGKKSILEMARGAIQERAGYFGVSIAWLVGETDDRRIGRRRKFFNEKWED